jgi:ribosome biogenesis GTPase
MQGLVMKSTGAWYDVRVENKKMIRCRLRGKLKLTEIKTTNPIAVGDIVEIDMESEDAGTISGILPRKNYIIRQSSKNEAFGHIIASNVDQAILVVSLTFPRTSIGFIDRYLANTESFRVPAKIIFNKSDLLDDDLKILHNDLSRLYASLGYENVLISAMNDQDMNLFTGWFSGKITLLSGHSGVGKSTILNRLDPGLNLVTKNVSTFANKGTHATTFATMFELNDNSFVIDTPGIKELGMIDMEDWEISHYFPEMRDHLGECRYNNCLHMNEPGCKVLELLGEGKIAASRYKSYVGMVLNEDNRK